MRIKSTLAGVATLGIALTSLFSSPAHAWAGVVKYGSNHAVLCKTLVDSPYGKAWALTLYGTSKPGYLTIGELRIYRPGEGWIGGTYVGSRDGRVSKNVTHASLVTKDYLRYRGQVQGSRTGYIYASTAWHYSAASTIPNC